MHAYNKQGGKGLLCIHVCRHACISYHTCVCTWCLRVYMHGVHTRKHTRKHLQCITFPAYSTGGMASPQFLLYGQVVCIDRDVWLQEASRAGGGAEGREREREGQGGVHVIVAAVGSSCSRCMQPRISWRAHTCCLDRRSCDLHFLLWRFTLTLIFCE